MEDNERNEKLKMKTEVLLTALKSKKSLSDTRDYLDFCTWVLGIHSITKNINDYEAKNKAIDSLMIMVNSLIEMLRADNEIIDSSIELLSELSAYLIDLC